jgi:hypothetical protein
MTSTIILPRVVAIWRHSKDIHTNGPCYAALFKCKQVQPGSWKFSFIRKPLRYIENADLVQSNEDEWFGAKPHMINIINNGDNYARIQYIGYAIVSNVGKDTIPVVKIENKCVVLPTEFTNLTSISNKTLRFKMRPGLLYYIPHDMNLEVREDQSTTECYPSSPRTEYKIPSHIVKEYLQNMIDKKETCPIDCEEFTNENICMTSCGHSMTHNALISWFKISQTCPVCRGNLTNSQIYKWKDI